MLDRYLFGTACLCSVYLSPTVAQAQDLLGTFSPSSQITVSIDNPVPPTLLKLLIDGREVLTGWQLSGRELRVNIPSDLSGQRHDLVLVLDKPNGSEIVESWVFDTPSTNREMYISVLTEVGSVTSTDQSDEYATASGRVDFVVGEGVIVGGMGFVYPDAAGLTTPATPTTNDFFLEHKGSAFGDEVITRLGTHYIYNDTDLIDQTTRRGLSVRLDDINSRYQVAVMAMSPSLLEEFDNLTGIEDGDDLVLATYGYLHPFKGGSTRLSFAGYAGNSATTPDGVAGSGEGYGLTLSGPLAAGRIDYAIGVETTAWQAGGESKSGMAVLAGFDYELLPDSQQSLGLSLDFRAIDQDHYSFLNPSRIVGEKGVVLGLEYYMPQWQLQAQLGYATTNYNGDPSGPTDALADLSVQAFYLPDDFTGGFLNGTTFYALLDVLAQDRLATPTGAIGPQDNTLYSSIIGFDKFNQNYSYAISYRHDILDDRTAADGDELSRRIDFLYSTKPSDRTELQLSAEIGHLVSPDGKYWDGAIGLSLAYDILPDRVTLETGVGVTNFENPTLDDGLYFEQSVLWEFVDGYNLVLSARYGEGTGVHNLVSGDQGWTFGVGLRTDFSLTRVR